MENKNNDLRGKYVTEMYTLAETKEPIYKGCKNTQCFCTGDCKEIIGWRDKSIANLDILKNGPHI